MVKTEARVLGYKKKDLTLLSGPYSTTREYIAISDIIVQEILQGIREDAQYRETFRFLEFFPRVDLQFSDHIEAEGDHALQSLPSIACFSTLLKNVQEDSRLSPK